MAREAVARIRGDTKPLERALGQGRRKIHRFGVDIKGTLQRAVKGAFSGLSTVAGFAGAGALALGFRSAKDFEVRMSRLGIASEKTAAEMQKIRAQLLGISKATGQGPEEILGALERFQEKTGQLDVGVESMETWAKVATATGSQMEDVALTAAALQRNMGLGADQAERFFSILIRQGKEGAVELKDTSRLMASLSPLFSEFGTKGVEGLAQMGAMLQIIEGGFQGADEAATGFQSLMVAIQKNAAKLERKGVQVFTDKTRTQMRDLREIIFQIDEKVARKDLLNVLGRSEAYRAILQLMNRGEDGLDELVTKGLEANDVQKDFARFIGEAGGKMAKFEARMKTIAIEKIGPHMETIANAAVKLAEAIDWIARNADKVIPIWLALKAAGPALGAALAGGGGGAAGGLLGGGGGGAAAGAGTGLLARLAPVARFLGVFGAGFTGVQIGMGINERRGEDISRLLGITEAPLAQEAALKPSFLSSDEELAGRIRKRSGLEARILGGLFGATWSRGFDEAAARAEELVRFVRTGSGRMAAVTSEEVDPSSPEAQEAFRRMLEVHVKVSADGPLKAVVDADAPREIRRRGG